MFYALSSEEYKLLVKVKDKLYQPHIKSGDEIRDCAHQLLYVLEHLVPLSGVSGMAD